MAVAIQISCSFSRKIISSVSPFRRATKGWVQGSPIGKLNFSFCCELRSKLVHAEAEDNRHWTLGVRSACRNTVTLAFKSQVGASSFAT